MKPDQIILLRHGESVGNTDKKVYARVPDYALDLTCTGKKQARAAGQHIRALLEAGTGIQYYLSPYWRTRRTHECASAQLTGFPAKVYEDPRLREQEWSGDFRANLVDYAKVEERRDSYGHFYFRLRGGESCADVYDRVSDFMNTLHRDFEKPDFPRNVIIITHGMTMRVFLMRWYHMSVEDFELLANPVNCEFWVMRRRMIDDHFNLLNEPRRHKLRHHFQYTKTI